ncbi:hypothetical protein [Haliangium ochraceum]|nr:hypothetical protein [Haliangium ochraceum]
MTRNLSIKPKSGEFDVPSITAFLEARPEIFADPHGSEAFVVCGLPSSVPELMAQREQDGSRFSSGAIIRVGAADVRVVQELSNSFELFSCMECVKWLCAQFDCSIYDESGTLLVADGGVEAIEALYPESVVQMEHPWKGILLKVGFFRELDHGDHQGPSLEHDKAESAAPDEERIAAYLDAGHLYIAATGFVEDWFADDEVVIGPPHLLTDGVYVWPADLPYYVRNYHVRLPKAFTIHVAGNDYTMPKHVDIATLKLA